MGLITVLQVAVCLLQYLQYAGLPRGRSPVQGPSAILQHASLIT